MMSTMPFLISTEIPSRKVLIGERVLSSATKTILVVEAIAKFRRFASGKLRRTEVDNEEFSR